MKVLFMGCLLAVTLLASPAAAQSCKPLPEDVVGKNLALKKPAYQSSPYGDAGPERAVDGRCTGVWRKRSCSHTSLDNNPWWYVDLGESQKIYAVVVKNRQDCCWERLDEAEVHVGDAVEENGMSNYLCGTIQNSARGSTSIVYCDGEEGRYVSIHLPRKDYLTICEAEVYGVP